MKVNSKQKELLHLMIRERFGSDLEGLRVAVLGLAFKPHTDDMREAPSRTLIRGLLDCGASVTAYDPIAMDNAARLLPDAVTYAGCASEALKDADCAVLVTEWPEFKELDWQQLAPLMKRKIVFDGRNICEPSAMDRAGYEYYCIGRGRRPK